MIKVLTIAQTVWIEMIRRKDIYVFLILLVALLLGLMSLNAFGLGGTVRYLTDVGLGMIWLFGWVLAINVASRQIPEEEKRGTIFTLLAKPVPRAALIAGKWLGAWAIVSAALLVFYLVILGLVRLRGGQIQGATLCQALCLHMSLVGILAAIAVAFSTRMHYDAAASMSYVVSLSAFLVLPRIPHFATQGEGLWRDALMVLYYLMPHFELFDMRRRLVHVWGPAPWSTILLVLAYGLLVTVCFLFIGWLAYRNKIFTGEAR